MELQLDSKTVIMDVDDVLMKSSSKTRNNYLICVINVLKQQPVFLKCQPNDTLL